MNECQKVHPMLSQYLEGELSAREKRVVAWHLNQCAAARKELHQIERLNQRLRELPEPAFPVRLHDRIMNGIYRPHLAEEDRKAGRAAAGKKGLTLWSFLSRPVWGLAAAAVFAFVFFALNPEWLDRVRFTRPSLLDADRRTFGEGADAVRREVPVQGFPGEEPEETAGASPALEEEAPSPEEPASKPVRAEAPEAAKKSYAPEAPVTRKAKPAPARAAAVKKAPLPPAADTGAAEVEAAMSTAGLAKETKGAAAPSMAAEGLMAAHSARSSVDASGAGRLDGPDLPRWSGSNARASTSSQELITDPQTLAVYWTLLNPGEPVPKVDFSTRAVVLLVSDERPTAGWRIVLDRADETSLNYVLWYREEGPPADGVVAQVITRPWSLQVIGKPSKPVIFKRKD